MGSKATQHPQKCSPRSLHILFTTRFPAITLTDKSCICSPWNRSPRVPSQPHSIDSVLGDTIAAFQPSTSNTQCQTKTRQGGSAREHLPCLPGAVRPRRWAVRLHETCFCPSIPHSHTEASQFAMAGTLLGSPGTIRTEWEMWGFSLTLTLLRTQ